MSNQTRFMVTLGFAALLGACGGGDGTNGTNGANGSDGSNTVTTTPAAAAPAPASTLFQVKSALNNDFLDAKTLSYTLAGVVSALGVVDIHSSGSGTLTQSVASNVMFEGKPVFEKTMTNNETFQIGVNPNPIPNSPTSFLYADANYVPLGSSNAEYGVVTGAVTLPQTGVVGDKGPLFTENNFASNNKASPTGTVEHAYAIEADTATTALLKLTQVKKDASGTLLSTTTRTFKMTLDGALTRLFDTEVSSSTSGSLTSTMTVTRTYQP